MFCNHSSSTLALSVTFFFLSRRFIAVHCISFCLFIIFSLIVRRVYFLPPFFFLPCPVSGVSLFQVDLLPFSFSFLFLPLPYIFILFPFIDNSRSSFFFIFPFLFNVFRRQALLKAIAGFKSSGGSSKSSSSYSSCIRTVVVVVVVVV